MFEFNVNSNIKFGMDAIDALPQLIEKYRIKKLMIVYDAGVKSAGIADKIIRRVEQAGADYVVFDQVIPNPTNEIVELAAELGRKHAIEGLAAVGGGSSIDLAKAVNLLMTNPGKIGDYAGINTVRNTCLPLIAIPTTAGTSSEITNVSALIDTEKTVKYVIIDDKLTASDVIIDPKLTETLPPSVTAATGMDAITHAIESYVSNMATPLTEYNSLKGLEILYGNLRAAVKTGKNLETRANMMLGCVITGFAFSNANLGLVHAIAHTLSAHFNLPHGVANATVLPYAAEYNAVACPKKMTEIAKAMKLNISDDDEINAANVVSALKALSREIGICTLSELGIQEEAFNTIAEEALKEAPLMFNPRQDVGKDDIISILRKAL